MIRRIVGPLALVALLEPISCLSDDVGPDRFTTANTCVIGDVEGCACDESGEQGERRCTSDGVFGTCFCDSFCKPLPDCSTQNPPPSGQDRCKETECKKKCICGSTSPDRERECSTDDKVLKSLLPLIGMCANAPPDKEKSGGDRPDSGDPR